MINDECLELCKKSPPSMFRKIHISELHKFQWQSLIDKLQIRTPILLKVFQVITSHRTHAMSSSLDMFIFLLYAWQFEFFSKKEIDRCVVFKRCCHCCFSNQVYRSRFVQNIVQFQSFLPIHSHAGTIST